MAVEFEQLFEFKLLPVPTPTKYELYIKSGGIMPEEQYLQTLDILDANQELPEPVNRCEAHTLQFCRNQAVGMAEHAGIQISAQETEAYVLLRCQCGNLSDQRILAEVLKITDQQRSDQLIDSYPNIFRKPSSYLETQWLQFTTS